MENKWIETANEKPFIGANVETSNDGMGVDETMNYTDQRTCILAGTSGGHGYFGEGFATDGSTGCEKGLILDDPKYWRYYD